MLNYLNAHLAYVSPAVVALLFVTRLLTKSGPPTIVKLLPEWFDVTTWSKYGWPGTFGQLLVNVVLAGGTVIAASLQDGLTEAELYAARDAVLQTIGIYHAVKLVLPKKMPKNAKSATTTPLAVGLLLLVATSCAETTRGQVVQTVLDQGQAICQSELLRSNTPKMLIDSGVLPELVDDVIEATCATLPVAEIIAGADKQRAPRARALQAAARERGLLP
jgi:hypothetical protein